MVINNFFQPLQRDIPRANFSLTKEINQKVITSLVFIKNCTLMFFADCHECERSFWGSYLFIKFPSSGEKLTGC